MDLKYVLSNLPGAVAKFIREKVSFKDTLQLHGTVTISADDAALVVFLSERIKDGEGKELKSSKDGELVSDRDKEPLTHTGITHGGGEALGGATRVLLEHAGGELVVPPIVGCQNKTQTVLLVADSVPQAVAPPIGECETQTQSVLDAGTQALVPSIERSESQTQSVLDVGTEAQALAPPIEGSETQTQSVLDASTEAQVLAPPIEGGQSQTQSVLDAGTGAQALVPPIEGSESQTQSILDAGSGAQVLAPPIEGTESQIPPALMDEPLQDELPKLARQKLLLNDINLPSELLEAIVQFCLSLPYSHFLSFHGDVSLFAEDLHISVLFNRQLSAESLGDVSEPTIIMTTQPCREVITCDTTHTGKNLKSKQVNKSVQSDLSHDDETSSRQQSKESKNQAVQADAEVETPSVVPGSDPCDEPITVEPPLPGRRPIRRAKQQHKFIEAFKTRATETDCLTQKSVARQSDPLSDEPPVKRKRGRPPSKTRNAAESQIDEKCNEALAIVNDKTPISKQGRPQKRNSLEMKSGEICKQEVLLEEDANSKCGGDTEGNVESESKSALPTGKRKRGRPPSRRLLVVSNEEEVEKEGSKGEGGEKTELLGSSPSGSREDHGNGNCDSSVVEAVMSPRKRGRPRKLKQPEEEEQDLGERTQLNKGTSELQASSCEFPESERTFWDLVLNEGDPQSNADHTQQVAPSTVDGENNVDDKNDPLYTPDTPGDVKNTDNSIDSEKRPTRSKIIRSDEPKSEKVLSQRKWKCVLCNKFIIGHKTRHMRLHAAEKLDAQGALKRGRRPMKKDPESYCNICKKHIYGGKLLRHNVRHHGAHPSLLLTDPQSVTYKCGVCDVVFPDPYLLSEHKKKEGHQIQSFNNVMDEENFTGNNSGNIGEDGVEPDLTNGSSEGSGKCPTELVVPPDVDTKVESLIEKIPNPEYPAYQASLKASRNGSGVRPTVAMRKFRFKCKTCGRDFKGIGHAKEHIENLHLGVKRFQCQYCQMSFGRRGAFNAHVRSHTGEKPFMCNMCGQCFQLRLTLQRHQEKKHGAAPKYADNKLSETGEPYQGTCNLCGKVFPTRTSLYNHRRNVHRSIYYCCDICNKLFKNEKQVHKHKKAIHERVVSIICDVCGKGFRHEGSYHLHMKVHRGDRAHKCDLCGKAFVQKSSLVVHQRRHLNIKPFQCTLCARKYPSKPLLNYHMKTHSNSYDFECQQCNKRFKRNRELKAHMERHLSLPKYKCALCSKAFCQQVNWAVHMRRHRGEKHFKCSHCDMAFVTKGDCQRHARTHGTAAALPVTGDGDGGGGVEQEVKVDQMAPILYLDQVHGVLGEVNAEEVVETDQAIGEVLYLMAMPQDSIVTIAQ